MSNTNKFIIQSQYFILCSKSIDFTMIHLQYRLIIQS